MKSPAERFHHTACVLVHSRLRVDWNRRPNACAKIPARGARLVPMRLTDQQRFRIRSAAARVLGQTAEVWLFGSRVDDDARGGDIDLYVELEGEPADILERQLRFYASLQRELGEQRIDVVVHRRGTPLRPIDREARRHGIPL